MGGPPACPPACSPHLPAAPPHTFQHPTPRHPVDSPPLPLLAVLRLGIHAALINFDDLSTGPYNMRVLQSLLTDGPLYRDLDWGSIGIFNSLLSQEDSGWKRGTVSPPNTAYGYFIGPGATNRGYFRTVDGSKFDLDEMSLTAGWPQYNGMTLTLQAYSGGLPGATYTTTLNWAGPTQVKAPPGFTQIDMVG